MSKKRFGLASIPAEDEKDLMFKEYHQFWRKVNSDGNVPFVPIYTAFREKHLKTLEPGPLRLYLFFAFAANNQYGHSWHSIERIAEFFGTQTRTIDNWIKILTEENLIFRERKGKKSHTTYLIPYSNTIIRHNLLKKITVDKQEVLDLLIKKIKNRNSLYGEIIDVYHFFQWSTTKKNKPSIKSNVQWLFVVTKRIDNVLTGHFTVLKNSLHMGVSEVDVEDLAVFQSPFKYNGQSVQGVTLTHLIKLIDSNIGAVLSLMNSMTAESWDWKDYPSADYGEIKEFFEEEEEPETEIETET
ncbi:hypothetical protein COJ46_21950 [Bacillus sp. AFS077874]|uniref:hypothetical protein n=1 Tax=unclassified Bacillus (in: firmicutes) TaxID=185979 RepID=UPI000BF3B62B|nr:MULTISPECIES: hypothetical protein [unclassified Bacillus (in: firmicutes)]PET71583.1 hypothetical protein CN514_06640 [Bacillus sp. AFS001701]PFM75329.1 hypothetical protein COJ46_21950 [Bacillus sp. AFS077874]